jgi:predicted nucleic acid-binding protein
LSHLLDANTLIDHFRRGPASKVTARLATTPVGTVFLSSIVVGELIYGAYRSGASYQAGNLALVASVQARFLSMTGPPSNTAESGRNWPVADYSSGRTTS